MVGVGALEEATRRPRVASGGKQRGEGEVSLCFTFLSYLIRCSFSPLTIQEKRKPREQGSGRGLDPSPILAGRARRLRRPYDLCRGRAVALRPLDKVVARLWVGGQGRRRGGGVNFFDGTGAGNRRVVFGELLVLLVSFLRCRAHT